MASYNREEVSSDDEDVFQDIRAREIQKFYMKKLESFLSGGPAPQNQVQPTENKFDIEKELLSFLNDFQSYKKTQDDKSVTSDDLDDDESDSDEDDEVSSCEEENEDDASVVVEGSVSGLSSKDLDLIEALTDSRQKGNKLSVEKQLSLLDLDEQGLNRQLKQPKSNDFLLNFQEDMNKLQKEGKPEEKEKKVKACYVCGGEIKQIGNYKASLEAHQKEPFHILKSKEKRSSAKSECSSVVGEASLPEFVYVNANNHFCCKICNGRPIGKFRNQLLTHYQSEEHRLNLQTRFDDPTKKKDDSKGRRAPKDDQKVKKDDRDQKGKQDDKDQKGKKDDRDQKGMKDNRDQKVKKEEKDQKTRKGGKNDAKEPKKDKLAYAIGFACIKPVNENQFLCTMCDKHIPVAKDMSTLMKNLCHHIESKSHVSKMEGMQESLKTIKENPTVQEAKKKLNDNVYKFICLPCNFDGYGYQFCKSHLKNPEHTSRIQILLDAKVPVNFTHGVKCVGCLKYIYGAKVNIDEHCVKCIKENGNNARRVRGNRNRPRRQNNRNDRNDRENNPRRNPRGGQSNRGRRPQNNIRPDKNVTKVDHEMFVPVNARPTPTPRNNSIEQGFVMLDKPKRQRKKREDMCVIS